MMFILIYLISILIVDEDIIIPECLQVSRVLPCTNSSLVFVFLPLLLQMLLENNNKKNLKAHSNLKCVFYKTKKTRQTL